jgi:Poxvirus A32 protein
MIKTWDAQNTLEKYLKEWGSFSMIINGMTRSGKSYLLRDLLTPILYKFDHVVVFSKTLCNGFYQEWLKTKFMYEEYDHNIVEAFKRVLEKHKQKKINTLFILDDCLSTNFKYESSIGELFMTSRHWGASVVILGQKCSYYSLGWMSNCLIFINMFCGSFKEKKYIAENIIADTLDHSPETKMSELVTKAYKIQTEICKNHTGLVVLPMEEEKLFQYKAL